MRYNNVLVSFYGAKIKLIIVVKTNNYLKTNKKVYIMIENIGNYLICNCMSKYFEISYILINMSYF